MRTFCWATLGAVLTWGGAARAADEDAPDEEPPPGETAPPDDAADETGDIEDDEGDEGDEEDPAAPPAEPIRRGLQLQGGFGFSDCTAGLCGDGDESRMENTRLALGLEISGWYRPIPMVAVGGGIHYNLLGTRDRERVTNSADYFTFELGGRFHPLQNGPIDAFAGLTFGYLVYGVSSDFTDLEILQTETTNAFAFAVQAGGEWYFAPRMSFGGLLKLTFPSWITQCTETVVDDGSSPATEDCDDLSSSDLPPAIKEAYPSMFWYLGGTFSYHLGG
jgi:hypothetical protein